MSDTPVTSPVDLNEKDDLFNYADLKNPGESAVAIGQEIIDGLSQAIYWACGRTAPMLTEHTAFTETYNGSGSDVLYLQNVPIVSVASLNVNGLAILPSTIYGQAGFFIQQDAKSIALRSGSTSGYPFLGTLRSCFLRTFPHGRGNIAITYTAGYDGCPPDLYLMMLKWGTVMLNRRLREDETSHMIPGGGQTNYRGWVMQPENNRMLQPYARSAMVNVF